MPVLRRVPADVHEPGSTRGRSAAELGRVGYFGSYARGEWGPGSDLDVVLVVARSDRPFMERGTRYDPTRIPVPPEALVYTVEELERLQREGGRFGSVLRDETVWVRERA